MADGKIIPNLAGSLNDTIESMPTTSIDAKVDMLRSELARVTEAKSAQLAAKAEARKEPITRNTFEAAFAAAATAPDRDTFMSMPSPLPPDQLNDIYARVQLNKANAPVKANREKLFSDAEINESAAKYMTNTLMGAVGRAGDIAGSLLNAGVEATQTMRRGSLKEQDYEIARSIATKEDIYADARDALRTETDPEKAAILRARMEVNSPANYTDLEKASLQSSEVKFRDIGNVEHTQVIPSKNERIKTLMKGGALQANIDNYAGSLTDIVNDSAIETMLLSAKADFRRETVKFMDAKANFDEGKILNGLGDIASAVASLTAEGGKVIIDNPAGVVQLMLQTAPDVITAARAMPAARAGDFIEKQREAKQMYRDTYGKEPTGTDLVKLNAGALVASLIDTYGDRFVGKGGGDLVKAAKALGLSSGSDIANAMAKVATIGTQAAVTGAAGEFVAEAGGNVATQLAGKQNASKVDYSEAYAEGVLGAGAGGGIATIAKGLSSASEVAVPVAQKMQARAQANEAKSIKELVSNVGSMDVAGATAVMKSITASPDATPEQKAEAIRDLETAFQHRAFVEVWVGEAEIAQKEQGFDETRQKGIDRGNQILAEMDRAAETLKVAKDAFRGHSVEQAYKILTTPADSGVEVTPEIARQAAATISEDVNTPYSNISTEMAREILDTRADILTADQVSNLRSYITTNQAFDNLSDRLDEKRVRSNIINGGNGNIGARTYVNGIISSIKLGDNASATKLSQDLTKFAERHTAKAEAMGQIIASFDAGTPMAPAQQIELMKPFNSAIKGSKFSPFKNAVPSYARMIQEEAEMLNIVASEMAQRVGMLASSNEVSEAGASEEVTGTVTDAATTAEETEVSSASTVTTDTPVEADAASAELSGNTTRGVTGNGAPELPRVQIGSNPDSFTNVNAQTSRDRADRAGITEIIEQKFAEGKTVNQVKAELTNELKFVDKADQSEFLVQVRATLGIPSRADADGIKEFDQWLTQRQARASETSERSEEGSAPGVTEPVNEPEADPVEQEELGDIAPQVQSDLLNDLITNEDGTGNPVVDFVSIKESKTVENPLHLDTQFIDKLRTGGITAEILSPYIQNASEAQINLLNKFIQFNEVFRESFKESFVATPLAAAHRDAINYFTDKSGNIKQSVVDAMSLAAFNWMIVKANDSLIKRNEDLGTLVGIDSKHHQFSNFTWGVLGNAGLPFNEEALSLGNEIVGVLGLTANKNAPYTLLDRIATSVGGHTLLTLNKTTQPNGQALLKFVNVDADSRNIIDLIEHQQVSEAEARETVAKGHKPYTLPLRTVQIDYEVLSNGIRKPTSFIQGLALEPAKNTGSFLSKLFSGLSPVPAPTFTPVSSKDAAQTMKRTDRRISGYAKSIHDKFNQTKSFLKPQMVKAFGLFSPEELNVMFGFKNDIESTVHKDNIESEQSKNRLINDNVEKVFTFLDMYQAETQSTDFSVPFYLDHETTSVNRAQLTQRIMNPQSDKIARHMMYRDGWNVTVRMDDQEMIDRFMLAVGQSLDVSLDKQFNAESLEKTYDILRKPVVMAGANAAVAIINDRATTQQLNDFKQAVMSIGTGAAAMDGLLAYAAYVDAISKDAESFETNLAVEFDGVTNGPMITLMQFGIAGPEWAQQLGAGGIYINSTLENVAEAKQQGIPDVYENVTIRMADTFSRVTSMPISNREDAPRLKLTPQMKAALTTIFGELTSTDEVKQITTVKKEGRTIAKYVVTPKTYQAGDPATKRKLGDEAIKIIRDRLAYYSSVANDPNSSAVDIAKAKSSRDALSNALKELAPGLISMKSVNGRVDYLNATIKENNVYDYESTGNRPISMTFARMISATYGAMFTQAVNEQNYLIAGATQEAVVVSNMAVMAFETARTMLINEAKINKANSITEPATPLQKELTKAELQEVERKLQDIFPEVFTALSKKTGTGISLVKKGKDFNVSDFTTELKVNDPNQKAFYIKNAATTVEAPGVRGVVNNILGTDGAIALQGVNADPTILNLYDAFMSGIGNAEANAKEWNKKFFEVSMNHSVPNEIANMAIRSIEGLRRLVGDDFVFDADQAKKYNFRGELISVADALAKANAFKQQANYLTESRRNYLKKSKVVVNQYYAEGAAATYINGELVDATTLTDAEMTSEFVASVEDTVTAINEAVTNDTVAIDDSARAAELGRNTITATADNDLQISEELTEALNANNGVLNLKQALDAVSSIHSKSPTANAVTAIVNAIAGKVKSNIKIVRYDSTVKYTGDLAWLNSNADVIQYANKSRGMFADESITGNDPTIILMAENMPHSGVNVETLMHELVHHLFDQRVFNSANSPVGEELQNLVRTVKGQIQNVIANDPESKQFVDSFGGPARLPALSNMREFVAWGLSSQSFQRILSQIAYTSTKELDGKLNIKPRTVLAKLRDLVQKVIFNRDIKATTNEQIDNALKALLTVALKTQAGVVGRANPISGISKQAAPMNNLYKITKLNSLGLFNALKNSGFVKASTAQQAHLESMLTIVVNSVLNPLNVNVIATANNENVNELSAKDKLDIFLADKQGIQLSNVPPSYGFNKSAQEVYVHGLYLNILEAGLQQGSPHLNAANDFFNRAKAAMTYKDFMIDPTVVDPVAIKEAQDRYDSVFTVNAKNIQVIVDDSSGLTHRTQSSDYLRNFLALAATNEQFRNALNKISVPTKAAPTNLFDRIVNLLSDIIDWISNRVVGVNPALSTTANIDMLTARLVGAELQAQSELEKNFNASIDYASNALGGALDVFKKGLYKLGSMPTFKNSKYSGVRLASGLARITGNNKTQFLFQVAGEMFERLSKGKQTFVGAVASEVKGTVNDNAKVHSLLRVANFVLDRGRKAVIEAMTSTLNKQFKGKLTKEQRTAITKAVLRTDMAALIDHGYSLNNMADLLTDPAYLAGEIQAFEDKLTARVPAGVLNFYLNQAEDLGFMMVRGYGSNALTIPNAYGIARLWGTGEVQPNDSVIAAAEPLIDALATLHAIKFMKKTGTRASIAANVIRAEIGRTDGDAGPDNNGMVFVLKQHQNLKAKALADNFHGKAGLMRKGYIPDITNPYIDVQAARVIDSDEMRARGYKEVYLLPKDATDPQYGDMALFVGDGAGLTGYLRSALSTTGQRTKGTKVGDIRSVAVMKAKKAPAVRHLFTSRVSPSFAGTDAYMQPVFTEDGQLVDYRYVISESAKDSLLSRNDDFAEVLGNLAGSVYDKAQTKPHNEQMIDALKEQYDTDIANGKDHLYIRVSARSSDPELKDAYNLLPYETREYAKQVFGSASIPIRAEFMNVVFGYRKLSIAQLWKDGGVDNNAFQNAVKTMFDTLFGNAGLQRASQFERAVQDVVRIAKSNVVVRMGEVTLMNLISNTYQLMINGLTMRGALSDQVTGYKKGIEYVRAGSRIAELNLLLEADHNPAQRQAMIDERNQLLHLQSVNPVRELIEAGLLQTIVMDVTQDTDPFSYSSILANKAEEKLQVLPEQARDAIKFVFMTRDSASFEFMNRITQFSDFAARYALFKHLTTRKDNPLDKSSAIQAVIEEFVNYDLPTHKAIQYGNDMGLIWFSRYWLRSQKIIMKNFAENPARSLLGLTAQGMLGVDVPDNTDSSLLQTGPLHPIRGFGGIWSGLMSNPILPN